VIGHAEGESFERTPLLRRGAGGSIGVLPLPLAPLATSQAQGAARLQSVRMTGDTERFDALGANEGKQ
jgi:hypothetical protein